jgi:hypothetical protein
VDEPARVDPAAQREMLKASMQLLKRDGTSMPRSSHYLSEVERSVGAVILCDGRPALDRRSTTRWTTCGRSTAAVIPYDERLDAQRIEGLLACPNVRWASGCLHAVFKASPSVTRRRLELALEKTDASGTRNSLEEFFTYATEPRTKS